MEFKGKHSFPSLEAFLDFLNKIPEGYYNNIHYSFEIEVNLTPSVKLRTSRIDVISVEINPYGNEKIVSIQEYGGDGYERGPLYFVFKLD